MNSIVRDGSSEARSLPLQHLRKITNDFSNERLIGEGGFGKVYKGVLQNGDMIAVKKLTSSMPGVHDRQFENEAHHLMRLRHPNIVQLVGYCSETETVLVQHNGKYVYAEKSERLLCLEYLPKGSLREHLSVESSGLDWDARYRIIEGVCFGLHYLHEEWQVNTPIIHMDLKPANILLDDNMVPKIADFGLSRLFGAEKTRTCTRSRDGTLGYMAPEYINRGLITKKLDIFSLGVIIIEIITGHRDYPDESETSTQEYTELVIKNWRNRLGKTPWYTSLEMDCQQIRRCIQTGLACVKLDRAQRPSTTRQIIEMLHGPGGPVFSSEMLMPPANEALIVLMKAAGMTYTSLKRNGQPKRRLLEMDLNRVETNRLERPAKKDFIELRLWPSSQDTSEGDGGSDAGASENGSNEALTLERDNQIEHAVSGGKRDAVTVMTTVLEDGYAWRKYGERAILNCKHPRLYCRCTYKEDRQCAARRQVQQHDDGDPCMYKINYFGVHSCHNP